jgi:hypothetical protein
MKQQPTLSETAKENIQLLEQEIEEIGRRIHSLTADQMKAVKKLSAWKIILELEKEDDPSQTRRAAATEQPDPLFSPSEIYGARAEMLRDFLQMTENKENGVTPKEVRDYFLRLGIPASHSFAGNALARLKAGSEIVERDGRYYWNDRDSTTTIESYSS